MSMSSWSYTSDLTFWPVTYDEFTQPTFGAPQTVKGTWKAGGDTQTTDDGEEFVPQSTFWTTGIDPARGWKVAKGAIVGSPPASAEIIRRVGAYDDSMFGEATDVVVYT